MFAVKKVLTPIYDAYDAHDTKLVIKSSILPREGRYVENRVIRVIRVI